MNTRLTPVHSLFCSGKIRYDLETAREQRKATNTAIIRLEQLYPFPADILKSLLQSYPALTDAVWVQEEPHNMGGWTFVHPRLAAILPAGVRLSYAGRVASASPATGNANVHKKELKDLLAAALDGSSPSPGGRGQG